MLLDANFLNLQVIIDRRDLSIPFAGENESFGKLLLI